MNPGNQEPTRYETLFGGRKVSVQLADHAQQLVVDEEVFVRQLKVGEFPKFLPRFGDEHALVEMYTGKPKEWVERLAPESFTRIAAIGEELNADFFAWCGRQRAAQIEQMQQFKPETLADLMKIGSSLSRTTGDHSVPRPG
jgi:hypothetical protein